jgi:hypothetical protein
MADLDERIRRLFDSQEPVSLDEVIDRRATPAPAPGHRGIIAVAVSTILFAGVIGLVATRHSGPTKVASSSTTSGTVAATPVEIRLVLDETRVIAGRPIHGEALITNTTSRTITVETCSEDGWVSVGLTHGLYSSMPGNPLIACPPSVHLSPGLTRLPVSISTDFERCTQSAGQATSQLPVCTSGGLPPLPPGQYLTRTVLAGLPKGTPLPPAIKVTLLPTK